MAASIIHARTDDPALRCGGRELEIGAGACDILGAALAECIRASLAPLLERHATACTHILIEIEWPDAHSEAAIVRLRPEPVEDALRQRMERAILRCPVAQRLRLQPRIEWPSWPQDFDGQTS